MFFWVWLLLLLPAAFAAGVVICVRLGSRPAPGVRSPFQDLRKRDQRDSDTLPAGTFVVVVEIDRFSTLRRSIGYNLSNDVLAGFASRIVAAIDGAELGRIGRTTIEFSFAAASSADAQAQLEAAVGQIERRMTIEDYSFDLSVTIGFAEASQASARDELVDQAVAALAAARARHLKLCFADAEVLANNCVADLELMRGMASALQSGEITLHYQPKLDARTDSIRSAEALVRWIRPDQGLVPTDRFIQIAEETGAIRELTDWVLARAIADQALLLDQGHDIEIHVNISGQLLPDVHFARSALELVSQARGKIGFEITETAVIGDPDAALANLRDFTAAGIKIAIDDYGSGLSSLAYLKQLPAHELKIDRMFVAGLTESNRDPLLVRSSIDLAHALEMEVTAEGVDDAMALSLLRVMGCDKLQGFYISPPIELDAFQLFLSDEGQLGRMSATPAVAPWAAAATNSPRAK